MLSVVVTGPVPAAVWSNASTRDVVTVRPGTYSPVVEGVGCDEELTVSFVMDGKQFRFVSSTHWGPTAIGKCVQDVVNPAAEGVS